MMKSTLVTTSLLLLVWLQSGCVPPASKDDTVQVKTAGIFDAETFEVIGGSDLGEVLTGSDPVIVTMKLTNNSKFDLTNINLVLDQSDESSMSMTFALTTEGIDAFPGKDGTCNAPLTPGSSCTINIMYNPSRSGTFVQFYTLTYKNYIKEITRQGQLNVLTGEPASLIFTNTDDQQIFNYGVIEQTEPEVRYELMILENRGGLSARNAQVGLISPDMPNSFSIANHNCPSFIPFGKSCQALVSYVPLNTLEADPEVTYNANLYINYLDSAKAVTTRNLNATYTYKSTKIQGNFDTNLGILEFTPGVIVGNKDQQSFRVINKGYREGIIKELRLEDSTGLAKAVCRKPASGTELECFDPGTPNPSTLAQSPFKIVDMDSCLDREAYGSITGTAGEACDFSITFWPSVTYATNMSFVGWTITFVYDSRWKGEETIIEEELFTITADSVAAALLSFENFLFGPGTALPDSDPSKAMGFFDIGRVALISNSAYFTTTSVRLKNYGPTQAEIVTFTDGQATPQEVDIVASPIASVSDPGFNTYWQNMATNCDVVDFNQFCSMTGRFLPMFYSNEDRQNRLFLDVEPNSPIEGPNRYKSFIATYKDGTTYEDDGSLRADRVVEFRVTGLLVTKGYLVFQNLLAGNVGTVYVGDTKINRVVLVNVGTGTIPYIKINDLKRFYYNNLPFTMPENYDITIVPMAPPAGVTKDCLTVLDMDNTHLDNPNPPVGDLAPNESCSLSLQLKRQDYDTYSEFTPPDPPHERTHYHFLNNTYDQWEINSYAAWGDHDVNFAYFDGDTGLTLPLPYRTEYGFFAALPTPYNVNINWRDPASIILREPAGIWHSTVLFRPEINLPPIPGAPVGWNDQINGYNIPKRYFTSAPAAPDISKQIQAQAHVAAFEATDTDYIFHMGSYPANGQVFTAHVISEPRGAIPMITARSMVPAIPEITLASGPTPGLAYPGGNIAFNFSSNVAGTFVSDLEFSYNTNLNIRSRRIRVIAEAISALPDVKIASQEYNVVMVGGTPVETLSGAITDPVSLRYLSVDPGFFDTYFAVKGSAVYAKKRYTVTNNSAFTVSNLSAYLQGGPLAQSHLNGTASSSYTLMNISNCSGVTLNPGQSCTFEFKWHPPAVSSNENRTISVQYEIAPNQYISKSFSMQLNAGDPAILTVVGQNKVQTTDKADGGLTRSSYPVDWGVITAPGHIQTVNYPHTVNKTGFNVVNAATLKASFLKMIEPAAVPAGNPVLIFNSLGRKIYATRGCLYGDDEFAAIPPEEKGFNNVTSVPNRCWLTFEYDANETWVGKNIDETWNVLKMEFYNNKRSSTDFMWFHLKGFVEPNYTSTVGGYINVSALSTGTVTLGWPAFTVQNANWGAITGYTVFYTQTQSQLTNIHSTASLKVDLNATTFSHTFNGLVVGRYYYFKVVPRRLKNGITYYSENKPLGNLEVVVPPSGSVYNSTLRILVDKTYQSGFGSKTLALSTCASKTYTLFKGGAPANKTKILITTPVWNFIKSDPDTVNFSTYSTYVPPAVSHWLSDAPTDIAPIFAPYGFDTTATSQYVPEANLLYQKPCADSTCNLLDKIVGGDGSELPYDANLYIKAANGGGVFRCYAPI